MAFRICCILTIIKITSLPNWKTEHLQLYTVHSVKWKWMLLWLQCMCGLNQPPPIPTPGKKYHHFADDITNAFSSITSFVFWFEFHLNLPLLVWLTYTWRIHRSYLCAQIQHAMALFGHLLPFGGNSQIHDDVIICKHFPRYWPFVRGIHWWIPLTKASDVELWCFLWSASE